MLAARRPSVSARRKASGESARALRCSSPTPAPHCPRSPHPHVKTTPAGSTSAAACPAPSASEVSVCPTLLLLLLLLLLPPPLRSPASSAAMLRTSPAGKAPYVSLLASQSTTATPW